MSCQDVSESVQVSLGWFGMYIMESVLARHAWYKEMRLERLCRPLKEHCRCRQAMHILLSFTLDSCSSTDMSDLVMKVVGEMITCL